MKPELLIVEDDTIIAESIATNVQQKGYAVKAICDSGESALEHLEDDLPDLVIMDIKLKGELSGIQVAERILKKYRIPIIYLTDHADDHTFQEAKKTLPVNYLAKPFQPNQLLISIELALFGDNNAVMRNNYGFFKGDREAVKVIYDNILFLKAGKVYCDVIMTNPRKKITLTQPLKEVYRKIPYPDLIRVHRSYVINKNHVDKIMGKIIFIGEERIKVGDTYDHVIRQHFNLI